MARTTRFPSGREPWQRDLTADFDVIAEWGAAAVVTLVQASELTRRRANLHSLLELLVSFSQDRT